ncbi:MAG: glycoside hydrolase family 16 protein [Gammaproteobacteria bacterium]|nr:glycoside hydrolase family 16 protein [Gammaproteobacteria bacterium]
MLQQSDNDEKNMCRDSAKQRLEAAMPTVESRPSHFLVVLACTAALLVGCESGAQTPIRIESTSEIPVQDGSAPAGQEGDWRAMFSDEFERSDLDRNNWTTCFWWAQSGCTIVSNDELQWYQPDEALIAEGVLTLRARKRQVDGYDSGAEKTTTYDYTSGMVTSGRGSSDQGQTAGFVFQYGYAEMRARIPSGKGFWPAFWLLPINHTSKPEIDVMEIYGDEPDVIKMNFHYLDESGRHQNRNEAWTGPDMSKDFHVYAVDWQPDRIVWYVDGIERWRYSDIAYVPNLPMYLLVNLDVGGGGAGTPDASTVFPGLYEIDYIRVWCRQGQICLSFGGS